MELHHNNESLTKHIFVDESGDLTLFDKKGRSMLGKEGVSPIFMFGLAIIDNPPEARKLLEELRYSLLLDPYFKGVPSFNPAQNKTAIAFHAKDDLPEVRREVFKLLSGIQTKVIVAVRRKDALLEEAKIVYSTLNKKINENAIYDNLVTRVFKTVLHKADSYEIIFSERGKTHRNKAFSEALERAKRNFARTTGIRSHSSVNIITQQPKEEPCLQIIDYYLWALYRFYVYREDRFYNLVSHNISLVMDIDDKRNHDYGEWYSKTNLLVLDKTTPVIS